MQIATHTFENTPESDFNISYIMEGEFEVDIDKVKVVFIPRDKAVLISYSDIDMDKIDTIIIDHENIKITITVNDKIEEDYIIGDIEKEYKK